MGRQAMTTNTVFAPPSVKKDHRPAPSVTVTSCQPTYPALVIVCTLPCGVRIRKSRRVDWSSTETV